MKKPEVGRTALNIDTTTNRSRDSTMEGENSIVEEIIKGMIGGATMLYTNNDEESDQARTMNCHTAPTLAQGIVGMALKVVTTPASAAAATNSGEGEIQQQVEGRGVGDESVWNGILGKHDQI